MNKMGKNRKIKMMQLTISKKAVSPLIATVLLMAFAVALGAIVMTWGKTYVTDTTEDVGTRTLQTRTCALDVNIALMNIGGSPYICKDEPNGNLDKLEFIINNKGSTIQD